MRKVCCKLAFSLLVEKSGVRKGSRRGAGCLAAHSGQRWCAGRWWRPLDAPFLVDCVLERDHQTAQTTLP